VIIGPTVGRLAGAWLIGEALRLALHLMLSIRRLHVIGRSLAPRLATATGLAAAGATPGFMLVRMFGFSGPTWVGLSIAAGAGILVAVWFAAPRSQLRIDIESAGLIGRVPGVVR